MLSDLVALVLFYIMSGSLGLLLIICPLAEYVRIRESTGLHEVFDQAIDCLVLTFHLSAILLAGMAMALG